jgi:hypothetical protein
VDGYPAVREKSALTALERLRLGLCKPGSCMTVTEILTLLGVPGQVQPWGEDAVRLKLFLLGAVNDPESYTAPMRAVFRGERLGTQDRMAVRRVALGFSRTLDSGEALASNLGFRAQMCQAYGPPGSQRLGPLGELLRAQVGPCPRLESWGVPAQLKVPEYTCLILNAQDPVTPPEVGAEFAQVVGPSATITTREAGHAWPGSVIRGLRMEAGSCRLG